ncbi:MAG: IMPACT family protein [Eubacteriales bacterium]|jgi:uncharacterized YigZ family protein
MEYHTLDHRAEDRFVEKKSEFIGNAAPVRNEEEALAFLNEVRRKYPDARHHVYAYRLREMGTTRFSDDGEPQGTGGKPVLNVLERQQLTDCVVVVTRYFGGILLGTGGLVRAYGHGASLAVRAAEPISMIQCSELSIACDYAQYGKLQGVVLEQGGLIDDTLFTDGVELIVSMPQDRVEGLRALLTDLTCGSVEPVHRRDKWQKFSIFTQMEEE